MEKLGAASWGARDRQVRENMARLFNLLDQELPEPDRVDFVNLDRAFNTQEPDADLFWDFIHPTPDGQALIAEYVFDHLRKNVLGISQLEWL